ncbi:hypothetical protein ABW20_dc0103582 [Dactylellina cionopaga]|nr:hypothetical protein ABW20_dc0103582 [Dactylellina cionopaga]
MSGDLTSSRASPAALTGTFYKVDSSYSEIDPVTAFALFGLAWSLISIRVSVLWFLSSEFQPAPIHPPDELTPTEYIVLNLFQVQSCILGCAMVFFFVLAPWSANHASNASRRQRKGSVSVKDNIWLNARLMLGGTFCMFTDSYLNTYEYLFAWNANAVNFGSWAKFMPFGGERVSSRYGVGVIWVIPVYMYFCCGSRIIGDKLAKYLRNKSPTISKTETILAIWIFQFWLDFAMQIATLRLTGAYAFAKTYRPLTIFAGDRYQYPIYNSICVASLTTTFSFISLETRQELSELITPIEAGYSRWRQGLRGVVRTFAVVGFCVLTMLVCFTIPLTLLGIIGDSYAELPSYMKPG